MDLRWFYSPACRWLFENLRKHLRLVFLDNRGYAPSPGPMDAAAFAPDKQLEDIERARLELGLGRIAVIGHSIHSLMALEYAKTYPENVSHVVMIGPPVFNAASDQAMDQYWQEFASPARKAAIEEAFEKRYGPWYPKAVAVLEDDWDRMVRFYDFPEASLEASENDERGGEPDCFGSAPHHGSETIQTGRKRYGPDMEAPDGGGEALQKARRSPPAQRCV